MHRRRADRESGMVTAETAVVLPVLLLVLLCAVAAVTVVGAQLRCVDAAREGARAAARGETAAVVAELAGRIAPDGAVTAVRTVEDRVRVTVSVEVAPLGLFPLRSRVSAEAVAVREPGVP
jgi:Flp pilus assembly protein TadG